MFGFQWFDIINGIFEVGGGWFTWNAALALYRAKELKGVYWPSFWFFGFWGLWNLVFYSAIATPLSFYGGVILVGGNLWWMALYAKYAWIDKRWSQ